MVTQEPAETFREERRSNLLVERYMASGIPEPSTDEVHNVIGTLHGKRGDRTILVFANMDHQPDMAVDPNVTITTDRVLGRGVPEDNYALSVLITLPDLLNRLGLTFNSDVVLLATTRSHGRGDLEGIRYFLAASERPVMDLRVQLSSLIYRHLLDQ